ncbi:MAG: hypothetical protein ACLGI8_10770 [Acidimicrobiia bacterium]
MPAPLSERFERSRWGRVLISLLVVVVIGLEVATHLPPSALDRAIDEPADRAVRLLGIEQTWAVFAPNPRTTSLRLEALVTFADGSQTTWTIPTGPRVGWNLRFYRWRKWLERARADGYRSIWRPTAEWIATIHSDGPAPVVRVELIRHFRENVLAGEPNPWQEATYFTLELTEDGGER